MSVLRRQLPLNVSNLSRQSCRLPDSAAPSQRPREASERVGWRQIKLWQIMSDWGAENKFRRGRAKDLSDVWGAAAAVFHIRLLRLWLLGGKRWRAEGGRWSSRGADFRRLIDAVSIRWRWTDCWLTDVLLMSSFLWLLFWITLILN